MQCKFCGQQLPKNAICCSRCGGSMTSSKKIHIPKARDEEMIFNIKPAFDPATLGVRAFFLAVFMGAVSTVTIGTLLYIALSFMSSMDRFMGTIDTMMGFWIAGATAFIITFWLSMYIAKKNTIARKFTFYQTRMEYTYNAFDGKFRYLEYTSILDSSVTKGPLQRMSNLGNISFVCVGSFHDYVVVIGDVRDPDYVYKKVLDLIEVNKELNK